MPESPFVMSPNMAKKKKKPLPKPDGCGDELIQACKEFLAIQVPETNVVFVDEFNKFMPLFNKELNEKLSREELTELSKSYFSRFSTQHPIKILKREKDPNGFRHPVHLESYKVDRTIPPTFRRVGTLNDLGPKIPLLMNALFSSTVQSSGPYDKRKESYTKAIADAIGEADKKFGNVDKQRAEFQRMSNDLLKGGSGETKPADKESDDDSPLSGMIDWS